MSWLFSQALVAEFLGESCLDGEPSAQSSGSPTQQAYLPPDKMTVFSRLSRFGMTYKPLTEDRGEALLTSYLAAFRAKTSPLPEKAQELTESAAERGDTWRGSLAKFDPVTSSWKTAQHSLLGDSDECSVTWPRSGMTANGQCWELPMLGRRTSVTGFGFWPTPRTAGMCGGTGSWELLNKNTTPEEAKQMGAGNGGKLNPTWVEWLMGWPLGWTDLKPLEMDKSHWALQQHGGY